MKLSLTVAALLAVAPTTAHAAIYVFTGTLSGANEVPPVSTAGTGMTTVTLDDVANTLGIDVSFSGLTGTTAAAHIHCCAPLGTNAIVATTTPTFAGFPLGVTSGAYSNTLDLTQSASYNPAFVTANGGTVTSARQALVNGLIAGQTYLNIHTSAFPSGEIRTLLLAGAAPEPASWAMMLLGFTVIGGSLRLAGQRRRAVPA